MLLCHTTLRGTKQEGANKLLTEQDPIKLLSSSGVADYLLTFSAAWCLERSQLAGPQSAQAKEMVSGKQPIDRE